MRIQRNDEVLFVHGSWTFVQCIDFVKLNSSMVGADLLSAAGQHGVPGPVWRRRPANEKHQLLWDQLGSQVNRLNTIQRIGKVLIKKDDVSSQESSCL
jgi:hypothetical protein